MKNYRWVRLLAVVGALGIALAACGGDDDDDDAGSDETTEETEGGAEDRGNVDGKLVLGALLPQSGDLAVIYDALHVPVQIAVDEINAAGGVNGAPVEIRDADDGTDANVASTSLDTLLGSDNVDAIIGAASSTTTEGILDKVVSSGVVQCSGSNTSSALTDAEDDGFYFRTAPPDKFQGPALAQLLLSDNRTKPAILARNDSYGSGFADSLNTALTDGGADVVYNELYDPDASDFNAEVSDVVAAGPDAVVVIGFNDDGATVLKEMIAQGVGPSAIPIYTADGMQSSGFGASVDAANPGVVAGMKGTAPAAAPGGVTHPFGPIYAATGNDTIFSAYYYDCTNLIALAAQAAGSDDPNVFKDSFADITSGGTACQTFAECLPLLEAGEDINYEGASGSVDFAEAGEPTSGVYDVWSYGADATSSNVEGVEQIRIEE